MKQIFAKNTVYIFLIVVMIFVQLFFSSLYRNISNEADEINREYASINLKTQALDAKIADLSSLSVIERKAKKLGFIYATDIIYLTSNNVLAKTQ